MERELRSFPLVMLVGDKQRRVIGEVYTDTEGRLAKAKITSALHVEQDGRDIELDILGEFAIRKVN